MGLLYDVSSFLHVFLLKLSESGWMETEIKCSLNTTTAWFLLGQGWAGDEWSNSWAHQRILFLTAINSLTWFFFSSPSFFHVSLTELIIQNSVFPVGQLKSPDCSRLPCFHLIIMRLGTFNAAKSFFAFFSSVYIILYYIIVCKTFNYIEWANKKSPLQMLLLVHLGHLFKITSLFKWV